MVAAGGIMDVKKMVWALLIALVTVAGWDTIQADEEDDSYRAPISDYRDNTQDEPEPEPEDFDTKEEDIRDADSGRVAADDYRVLPDEPTYDTEYEEPVERGTTGSDSNEEPEERY